MNPRKYWPFSLPSDIQETEEVKSQIGFMEQLQQAGHEAYSDEGNVLGGVSAAGRVGELLPRGGKQGGARKYWEIILCERSQPADTFFVEGFENAAQAILRWLRGEDSQQIRKSIHEYLVDRPGQRGW